jgi:hypothetical protein
MFNSAFDHLGAKAEDYYHSPERAEIDWPTRASAPWRVRCGWDRPTCKDSGESVEEVACCAEVNRLFALGEAS